MNCYLNPIGIFSILVFCFITACDGPSSSRVNGVADTVGEMTEGDNSRNSLDWEGTYKGILPCADCEGIETMVILKDNDRYTLSTC